MSACNVKEGAQPTELSSPAGSLRYCASQLTALVLWLRQFPVVFSSSNKPTVPD